VKGADKYLPHLLGHEGGGVVEKIGPGVTTVKKGDHVVMHWMKGEGIHSSTPTYMWRKKPVNAGWVTTFNEYAVVSENRVTAIPHDFSLKTASLFGCAITTAFGVFCNDARVKAGESVLIFGVGGVGSALVKAAKTVGANPIIAVDVVPYKLQMALSYGASHVINGKKTDVRQMVAQITGSMGIDIAIDTTGINAIRELAYSITSPQGRTILVGVPKKEDTMCIDSFPLHFGKILRGSHGGDTQPAYDIPRLIRLVQTGALQIDNLITHEFSLSEINVALNAVRTGKAIRAVINMIGT
jgi:S-(hydroxymethyl)glutathione dehydrogenase/alcohol dehydrogenase